MKALWLAALAAIAGLGFQAPDGLPRLVVIIDADAPAADPAHAARLRGLLLSGLDQGARPVYVELTGDAARAVPDAEAASFSRTTFTVTPPIYGGLSVTFAEGVETLRGNEAVRDGVVDCECPVGTPGDCRARVQAAVNAMVRDTERPAPASCATSWRRPPPIPVPGWCWSRPDGRPATPPALPSTARSASCARSARRWWSSTCRRVSRPGAGA